MMEKGKERLLHSFGQADAHEEAIIIGNKRGLLALKEAIEQAINTGKGSCVLMPCDAENYEFQVLMNEEDWQEPFWQRMKVPYSELTDTDPQTFGPDAYIHYELAQSKDIPSVEEQIKKDREFSERVTNRMREFIRKNNGNESIEDMD